MFTVTNKIRFVFIFVLIAFSTFVNVALAKNEKISGIRIWPSPASTRLVFDISDKAPYKMYTLESPDRIVIDMENVKIKPEIVKKLSLNKTSIKEIRYGYHPGDKTRVVIELTRKLSPTIFFLEPNATYGNRLVVDLENPEKQAILSLFELDDDELDSMQKTPTMSTTEYIQKHKFVVAIDCGHGGEDPGAIGPRGTKEKDVVLAIGKKLKSLINKEPDMQAFLTRGGDYYVALRERFHRARKRNADLFISIHADAFKDRRAKGASVFVLSERGASSEAAKWIADKENSSDLVGGLSLNNKTDLLASVLLDLSQTASKAASMDAAKSVLRSLGKVAHLHKPHVERAGFLVLKAPDVPSLLVETGFISNPETEKKLRSSYYQQQIAKQIFSGVKYYASNFPQHHIQYVRKKPTIHVVKRGDTLSELAKKYRMPISKLKSLNKLKSSVLRIGQKLKVENE